MNCQEGIRCPTRVIDIGCGDGASLLASGFTGYAVVVGVDVNLRALRQAAERIPKAMFVLARAEALPFADTSFDQVLSGVALPYIDIPEAVKEMCRVLAPGGGATLTLHSFGFALSGRNLLSVGTAQRSYFQSRTSDHQDAV